MKLQPTPLSFDFAQDRIPRGEYAHIPLLTKEGLGEVKRSKTEIFVIIMEYTTTQKILFRLLRTLMLTVLFLLPWQTVYIFFAPSYDGVIWQWGVRSIYATEILVWVSITVAIILQITSKSFPEIAKQKPNRFLMLFSLPFLYALASQFWAPLPALAVQQATRLFAAFLFAIILSSGVVKRTHLLWHLVLGSIPAALLGVWQTVTQSMPTSTVLGLSGILAHDPGAPVIVSNTLGRWLRASGPFPHPNIFGGYLVLVMIGALYLRLRVHKKSVQLFLLAPLCLIGFTFVLPFSRSALFALVCVFVSSMVCNSTRQTIRHTWRTMGASILAVLAGFIIASILFFPVIYARVQGTSTHEMVSLSERTSQRAEAWAVFQSAPILGTGIGNYTVQLGALYPGHDVWDYQPVHTIFLLILAEFGLLGSLFISIALGATVIMYNKQQQLYRLCLVAIPLLPLIFFDHYLYTTWAGLCLLSVAIALFGLPTNRSSPSS